MTYARALLALVAVFAVVQLGPAARATAQNPDPGLSPASVEPAGDELLAVAPERAVVDFGVPLAGGQLTVFDETGTAIASTTTVGRSAHSLEVEVDDPVDGTYLISWSAATVEGGSGSGGSIFRLDTSGLDAVDARAAVSTDTDERSAVRVALVAVQVAAWTGAIVLVGTWILSLRRGQGPGRRRRTKRLLWVSWSIAISASLVGFAIEGLRGTGLGLADSLDPSLWAEVADTSAGVAWLAAVIVLGLAAPGIAWVTDDHAGTNSRVPHIASGGALSVALLGALIVATPALGGSQGSDSVSVSEATEAGSLEMTLAPGEIGGNEIHLYLFDEDGLPSEPDDASLRVRSLSAGVGPVDATLVRAGPNHFLSYDLPLPFSGDWEIEIVSTSADGETESTVATVEVS